MKRPEDIDPRDLGEEIVRLQAENKPAAIFTVKPFEAYTIVAALQGTSRNPALSEPQREIVVNLARQIAEQLYEMAKAILGEPNTIHDSLEMGFNPEFDRPRGWRPT